MTLSGKLESAFLMLARSPKAGFLRSRWAKGDIRFFVVKPYIVAYEPSRKPIRIVNVLHSAVDVGRVLRARRR